MLNIPTVYIHVYNMYMYVYTFCSRIIIRLMRGANFFRNMPLRLLMCVYHHVILNNKAVYVYACIAIIVYVGNNYYGEEVKTLLQGIGHTSEREAYILMDRVNPPTQLGFILHSGAVSVEPLPLISELGVFGVFVRYEMWTCIHHQLTVLYKLP